MLKLGLVGCGAVASNFHIPAISVIPEIELEAVSDTDSERARKFAQKNAVSNVYSSHEEMLDNASLDAVLICTPPATHARVVLDTIKRRRHVICEKPFVLNPDEANMIASQETDSIIFPAHNYIFTPSLVTVREWVAGLRFGELKRISADIGVGFWSWRSKTGYRLDDLSGVISDLLYHVVYVINAFSCVRNVKYVKVHRKSSGVVDKVAVNAQLEENVEADLSADWTGLVPHFSLKMECENGYVHLDLMTHPYGIDGKENNETMHAPSPVNRLSEIRQLIMNRHPSFVLEHRNFLNSIESKKNQQVTVRDAVNTLNVLQEIKEMII